MSQTNDLLFELGCEELPPLSLQTLSNRLAQHVCDALTEAGLSYSTCQNFATPRRLAFIISDLAIEQPDSVVEKRGPSVAAAFDADGKPTKAAEGFAKSCGASFDQLERLKTDKGEWLFYKTTQKGQTTADLIPSLIEKALAALPIAKRMRWGDLDSQFVRPVQWAVLLFGQHVIHTEIYGVKTDRQTLGHRFHAPEPVSIAQPSEYESNLKQAFVIANFEQRKQLVQQQAVEAAKAVGGFAHIEPELLDEVCALVEHPVAITGQFEPHFLKLPKEVLITTMQINQKYFPVLDDNGDLKPYFITISNIQSSNEQSVINGNERVIRPRLADAEFFWKQDTKTTLADRVTTLDNIIFRRELGTVGEKVKRVEQLASTIAGLMHANQQHVQRAAQLCKTDLLTEMVGEFASLQGLVGRYYALENGEDSTVAHAIEQHYWPKQAGGTLPQSTEAKALALADKLDTVVGIFSIGQHPTGEKDPFALRRQALGILRIIVEGELTLDLDTLIDASQALFNHDVNAPDNKTALLQFFDERFKGYCLNNDFSVGQFAAVSSLKLTEPLDQVQRLNAVKEFSSLDAATTLSEANKRIKNLLKGQANSIDSFDEGLLTEADEVALLRAIVETEKDITPLLAQKDYVAALKALSLLKEPVDAFFENIFIMADDQALKNARLGLVQRVYNNFVKIADISMI